jgi:hypothetical protein
MLFSTLARLRERVAEGRGGVRAVFEKATPVKRLAQPMRPAW